MRQTTLVRASAAVASWAIVLVPAAAAFADDEITIDHVESDGAVVNVLLSVDHLPPGVTADASSIEVAVEGRRVEAATKTVAAGDIERSTMLVLDTSNSMQQGGKFVAAKAAVDAFLAAAPDDVRIGLVTFAGRVSTVIEPTINHAEVEDALADVTLSRGTSVYDGIAAGVDALGTEGSRSLLLLSDGADTGSDMTLEVLSREAAEAEVVVDVVSLAQSPRADELAGLADATNGSVIPADPDALSNVFDAQADALSQQLLLTFDEPAEVSGDASIDITVSAGGQSYRDSTLVTLAGAGPSLRVVDTGQALISRPIMLLGALALALGLAGILSTVISGATDTRSGTERRLDSYFNAEKADNGTRRRRGTPKADFRGSALGLADKVVSADLESRISRRLMGAGSALTAAEWLLLHSGIAVVAALVGFLIGGTGLSVVALPHGHRTALDVPQVPPP